MEIVNKIKDLVIRKYSDSLDLVILFGSFVKGKFNELSDIDLAIKVSNDKDILDVVSMFVIDVAKSLNVIEDRIDILLLNNETPIDLEFDVFSSGILIYSRDKEFYVDMVIKAFSKHADYIIFLKKLTLRKAYAEALWRNIHGKTK